MQLGKVERCAVILQFLYVSPIAVTPLCLCPRGTTACKESEMYNVWSNEGTKKLRGHVLHSEPSRKVDLIRRSYVRQCHCLAQLSGCDRWKSVVPRTKKTVARCPFLTCSQKVRGWIWVDDLSVLFNDVINYCEMTEWARSIDVMIQRCGIQN